MATVISHTPGPWVIDGLFDSETGVDILAVEDPANRGSYQNCRGVLNDAA